MAVANFLSRNGGGGGGLQAGGLPGLRRSVGACGEGGVGRRKAAAEERKLHVPTSLLKNI